METTLTSPAPASPHDAGAIRLEMLAQNLIGDTCGRDPQAAAARLLIHGRQILRAAGMLILQHTPDGRWVMGEGHATPADILQQRTLMSHACRLATLALEHGAAELAQSDEGTPCTLLAIPLATASAHRIALVVALPTDVQGVALKRRLLLAQLLATALALCLQQQAPGSDRQAQIDRVMLEVLNHAELGDEPRKHLQLAVDRLVKVLGVDQLYLGRGRRSVNLELVSGRARFDRYAELSRLVVSVMEQGRLTAQQEEYPCWISLKNIAAARTLVHQLEVEDLWLVRLASP